MDSSFTQCPVCRHEVSLSASECNCSECGEMLVGRMVSKHGRPRISPVPAVLFALTLYVLIATALRGNSFELQLGSLTEQNVLLENYFWKGNSIVSLHNPGVADERQDEHVADFVEMLRQTPPTFNAAQSQVLSARHIIADRRIVTEYRWQSPVPPYSYC